MQNVDGMDVYLIVGLGNPGILYRGTRHNTGFLIVEALAEKWGVTFHSALVEAKGKLAPCQIDGKRILLLLPLTYMNESGTAVRKCIDYYKVPIHHCLVVLDDADLSFGTLRLREKGSTGGHNGLKSIEAHLGSDQYPRLRIGIGKVQDKPLADHVLEHFSQEEKEKLPDVVKQSIETIEGWLHKVCKTNGEEHVKN